MKILNSSDWRSKAKSHSEKVLPWIEEFRFRRARGQVHPVADFLFTYYSFRPGQLTRWSPGIGFSLEESRDIIDMYEPETANTHQLESLLNKLHEKRLLLERQKKKST